MNKLGTFWTTTVLSVGLLFAHAPADAAFNFTNEKFMSMAPVFSQNGLVACSHPLAAYAGIKIMEQGGNAFDAAVATALTLGACDMSMCGPGGASFWLLWNAKEGKLYGLDADTQAPAAATPDKFADRSDLLCGLKAMGIPGSMKAYWSVLERFGNLPFEKVMQPAVGYLENGYVLSQRQAKNYKQQAAQAPVMFPNLARVFAPDGNWPDAGAIIKNPELAATYRTVAKEGIDAFYKGSIAKAMVDYMQANDGLWTMEDLANYEVKWVDPLHVTYKGKDVYGMPLPSNSLMWMEALKIAEGYDWSKIADGSLEWCHLMVEIDRLAHADSYQFIADPSFIKDYSKEILSDNYIAAQRKRIDLNRAAAGKVMPGDPEAWSKAVPSASLLPASAPAPYVAMADSIANMTYRGNTNHVVVIDKDGNCVSFTHTLGQFFGGQDILGNTGVIGNNGMDWFDLPGNHPWTGKPSNSVVAPNKRNRWTLCPGMVFENGKPVILIGGAGAESTMGGLFQVLLRELEYGYNPQAAIMAPRFLYGDMYHYTAGSRLHIEPEMRANVEEGMRKLGHDVVPGSQVWRMSVGNIWSIMIDPATGTYAGGAESRNDGHVAGY